MPRRKKIPLQAKVDILTEAGYRCGNPACNIVLTPDILEDHHIIGVSEGGGNETSNLLALCPVCHSLYTHKKVTLEAVRHWKRMLVALNHAYSREAMDLLVFLNSRDDVLTCSTDGMLKFVGLVNAGLVEAELHPLTPDACLAGTRLSTDILSQIEDARKAIDSLLAGDSSVSHGYVRQIESHPPTLRAYDLLVAKAKEETRKLLEDPSWYRPLLYQLRLTDRGRMLVEAWLSGDQSTYLRTLEQPGPEEQAIAVSPRGDTVAGRVIERTWDDFWADLIMLRFHAGDPDRWAARRRRARWLADTLGLAPGARVVDLGCGDGILDICLAELGARVTAVDRTAPLIAAARAEPGADEVDLRVADLRGLEFPPGTLDVVLLLDVVGLMSVRDDADLVRRAFTWLAPSGRIVVGWPAEPSDVSGHWHREFEDGTLDCHWAYDQGTRLMHVVPVFQTGHGERVELHDPHDPARPDHCGVLRYVYPEAELTDLLADAGLIVRPAHDGSRPRDLLLIGTREG